MADDHHLSSPAAPASWWAAAGLGQRGVDPHGLLRRALGDPLEIMQRVADQSLALIDHADGALVGLLMDDEHLRYVCAAGYLREFVGESLALEGSLSGRAIRTHSTLITEDTETDPRVNRAATRAFSVGSSVCVPLGRDREPIGVLNISARAHRAFDEHDAALMATLADFMATVLGAATDFMATSSRLLSARRDAVRADGVVGGILNSGAAESEVRTRIERVIAERDHRIVMQPVYDLRDGSLAAVEALARIGEPGSPAPDVWLREAHTVGLGVELELELLRAALALSQRLPAEIALALNAGPEALVCGAIEEVLAGAEGRRLIVELTEHVPVDDYPRLAQSLARLRRNGAALAIDDAGAGFSSLMHILKLSPDYIKLDRQLVAEIDRDPVRRCLVASLMRFAAETQASIVAEGVESERELEVLQELDVDYAQGFHLCRPVPVEQLARAARLGCARIAARPAAGSPAPWLERSTEGLAPVGPLA